ncbi:phytanoyl-CoA dioxygenase family protein [Dehalococcoidia bacterium]|nr:phytanoyl-CoA dioxygenase family protein [Dehalococcoidia bacterium]
MRLSEQQIAYFHIFGFLKFDGLFKDDIDAITSWFEQIWASHGGGHHGKAHDNKERSALLPFIDRNEYMSALLDDSRIVGIAGSILGDDFNYTASDGNYYVGDTGWHSDSYTDSKYMSVKMAFYLDPVTKDTGCLRVIPGSHKVGDRFADMLHETAPSSKFNQTEELWGMLGAEVPAVILETQPGDMLMFNHGTKHASFGGGTRRRMFTINLQERHAVEDLEELRNDISGLAQFWHDKAYGDTMIKTAGPGRMIHLEQRLANDGHLLDLVSKAKEEMTEPSRG